MQDVCENSRKELLFSYLDIKTEKQRNFKKRAYSELILKSFYSNNEKRWSTLADIKNMVESFSGIKGILKKSIQNSLDFLTDDLRYIEYSAIDKKWRIKDDRLKKIGETIEENKKQLDDIIENFLTSEMDEKVVREWFLHVCEVIFSREEEEFLRAIAFHKNGTIREFIIDAELDRLIEEFNLESFKENLKLAFNNFIKNLSDVDSKFLLLLSQNILTSKIIAIDLDIDSLFSNLLKDSTVLVDTNVFINQILDDEKYDDLFDALKNMGAKFCFIAKTKEEFEHVVDSKRDVMILIAEKGFANARINDDFYVMANKLGCKDAEDVERFFDNNIFPFPPDICGVEIKEMEEIEYDKVGKKINDEIKLSNSQRYKHLSKYKSKKVTIEHDLLLNDIAIELRRKKENAIILTSDWVMQHYSIQSMKKGDRLSHWIHVKALLSIISACMPYKDGFAKIFKNILQDSCCIQGEEGFNLEDVKHLMNGANDIKIEECSKINECVEVVRKHRLMGLDADSEELKRSLDDIIAHEHLPEENRLKHDLEQEREDKKVEISKRDTILIDGEYKKIKRNIRIKYLLIGIFCFVVGFLLSIALYKIVGKIWSESTESDWVNIFISIFMPVEGIIFSAFFVIFWPKYCRDIEKSSDNARDVVDKLLKS